MCGICGFSFEADPIDKKTFEEIIDLASYRGPDDRGSFYEGTLALGHRRLAILDLSPDGHQPFHFGGRYVGVYNGEIYNYVELRQTLAGLGYAFHTSCDTEVLMAAYDHYGPDCVQHFNGMWAFCIYDKHKNQLFCSRDRFGVKPFYYYSRGGCFGFASEIKQLLPMFGTARANKTALSRFLVLGEMDEGRDTLFEGILQLLPGHSLTFDRTTRVLRESAWYTLADDESHNTNYEDACRDFHRLFMDSVRFRLRADVAVGSCLSGGLDSSAIVGAVHQLLAGQGKSQLQHTVSSCYNEAEFNEQNYIDMVIRDTGAVSHKVFPKIDDDPAWLDKILWHMDEPLPSSSPYSQWCVFEEAARQNLRVMLDGQGADEQLAGYAQFYPVYFVELLRRGRLKTFWRELFAYKRLRSAFQPVSALAVAGFCLLTAFLPKGLMRGINTRIIKMRKPRLFSLPQWRKLLLDSPQYTLPGTRAYIRGNINGHMRLLLHLEDRNSMAHSVEARIPFLDPALVQRAYDMPFSFKIRDGMSKAVLRDGLRGLLPPEVRARQNKMGFPAPEAKWVQLNRAWFQNELAEACERFSFLLDKAAVMEGFADYLARPQTGEFVWWRIMCANRWAKLFKVAV